MWLNSGRTIPVHAGQTQDWGKVPEVVEAEACGWAGATWGTGSCQLLHKFFSRFLSYETLHARKGTQLTVGYHFFPLIFFYLICSMSTPSQYPYSAGKSPVMWKGFGRGQRCQTAGEEQSRAALLLIQREAQNNQALNVLQFI